MVEVDERGLVGDRAWAVYDADGRLASGKNTRRFRRMDPVFGVAARTVGDAVELVFPVAGRTPWRGVRGGPGALGPLRRGGRAGPEADVPHQDAGQVSVVGTATLRELAALSGLGEPVDPRHLRTNLVVETDEPFVEESWLGKELTVGGVRLVRSSGSSAAAWSTSSRWACQHRGAAQGRRRAPRPVCGHLRGRGGSGRLAVGDRLEV